MTTRWQHQAVKIKINSDGVPGVSRDDLLFAQSITLYAVCEDSYPATSWKWEFLWKPIGSAATLSTPTASTSGFTIDSAGSYLIQLTVNSQIVARAIAASKTSFLNLRIPAKHETDEFPEGQDWASSTEALYKQVDVSGGGMTAVHSIGGAYHSSDIFANLNSKITDADLIATTTEAGGDLAGFYPDLIVTAIEGYAILNSQPIDGYALTWNAGLARWESDKSIPGGIAGGDLASLYPNPVVVGLRERMVSDSAPLDGYVYVWCQSTHMWSPQTQDAYMLQNRKLANVAPSDGEAIVWNAAELQWKPGLPTISGAAGGDLLGLYPGPTVAKIQGRAVLDTTPPDGYVLVWNSSSNVWSPQIQDGYRLQNRRVSPAAPSDGYVMVYRDPIGEWTPESHLKYGTFSGLPVDSYGIQNPGANNTLSLWSNRSSGSGNRSVDIIANVQVPSIDSDHIILSVGWRDNAGVRHDSVLFKNNTFEFGSQATANIFGTAEDSELAIGITLGSDITYSTSGSKLLSIKNGGISGSEKLYVGYDGTLWSANPTLQNRNMSLADPLDGYTMVWNASASVWSPQIQDGYRLQNRKVLPTIPTDGYALAWSASDNAWKPTKISGVVLPGAHAATHQNGGSDQISVSGLNGVLADKQDANKLQGLDVLASVPLDGYVLVWNTSALVWSTQVQDAYMLSTRKVSPEQPLDGYALVWDTPVQQWRPQIQSARMIYDRFVSSVLPTDGYALTWNLALDQWEPDKPIPGGNAGGDLSETYPSPIVSGLQGRSLSSNEPIDGYTVVWNDSLEQWEPNFATDGYSGTVAVSGTISFVILNGVITNVIEN